VPSYLREESSDCPFDEDDIEHSKSGELVTILCCLTISIITTIMTFIIWIKYWKNTVVALVEK
jgi:hypothetical protein